ncbi:MAG: copper resistance protein CopZ [Ruminococcus sp.]|nr:copper resistance protein CopZ [Candidatus Copronaster equi]
MIKTTLIIEGMECNLCETHINELIRKTCDVKKVVSSHADKKTEIISEKELDMDMLCAAIKETGYEVSSSSSEEYKKKGLFSFRK